VYRNGKSFCFRVFGVLSLGLLPLVRSEVRRIRQEVGREVAVLFRRRVSRSSIYTFRGPCLGVGGSGLSGLGR